MEMSTKLTDTWALWVWVSLILALSVQPMSASSYTCEEIVHYLSKCPTPPTVDTVQLGKYVGKWYQIGTNAQFAFAPYAELGAQCCTANYTAPGVVDGSTAVKVYNKQLNVEPRPRQGQVLAISSAALNASTAVQSLCLRLVGPKSAARLTSLLRKSSDPNIARPFTAALDFDIARMSRHAGGIFAGLEAIQLSNSLLNGGAKPGAIPLRRVRGRLQANVLGIQAQIRRIRRYLQAMAHTADALLKVLPGTDALARRAAADIRALSAPHGVLSMLLAPITASSGAIAGVAADVGRAEVMPFASAVVGRAVQNPVSKGKLAVSFGPLGLPGPYWIIKLTGRAENGYDLAVVFGCSSGPFTAFTPQNNLYILSRRPAIPQRLIDATLAEVRGMGILLGGENPFLLTSQNRHLCQSAWASP